MTNLFGGDKKIPAFLYHHNLIGELYHTCHSGESRKKPKKYYLGHSFPMYTQQHQKKSQKAPSTAIADTSGKGKTLPAVPVLQLHSEEIGGQNTAVVQRKPFENLSTPIGVFTGDQVGEEKVVSFDSEEEDIDSESSLDIPEEAQLAFDNLKEELEAKGWKLLPTKERDHCYTEVIRHYWEPGDNDEEEKDKYDIPSYAHGVPGVSEDDVEKIVYYAPNRPLLDLIHEMDHVYQQEEVFKSTGEYLFTNWDAQNWDGKVFGQMSTSVPSSFYSEENLDFSSMIRDKLGYKELSDGQNEYAEYHNYMLEFLRYCVWKAPLKEKLDIKGRIEEYKPKAKKYAEMMEEEGDDFIQACETIKPLAELETEYKEALSTLEDEEVTQKDEK